MSVQTVTHSVSVLGFHILSLESCICSDMIFGWIRVRVGIKFCANLRTNRMGTVAIRQAVQEERLSDTRVLSWKSPNSPRPLKVRQVSNKVKSTRVILLDVIGIVQKEFALAGQTFNSANFCYILRRLRENVWRPRPEIWLLHHDNAPSHTFIFHHRISDRKQHDCRPPPVLTAWPGPLQFLSFLDWWLRHFDTTEMTEAETSQDTTSRIH
jgi:hypothetical protein